MSKILPIRAYRKNPKMPDGTLLYRVNDGRGEDILWRDSLVAMLRAGIHYGAAMKYADLIVEGDRIRSGAACASEEAYYALLLEPPE